MVKDITGTCVGPCVQIEPEPLPEPHGGQTFCSTLCDTVLVGGEADITADIQPFADMPTVSPTYYGQIEFPAGQEALLWSGGEATLPPDMDTTETGGQVHYAAYAQLGTPDPLVGMVELSVQLDFERTGPNNGRANTGGLFLFNGDEQLAFAYYPQNTAVGATGQILLTASVPAEDLIAGNIGVVSISEVYQHAGGAGNVHRGGWQLSSFLALTGATEQQQQFRRCVTGSATEDFEMDGVTPYEVQGAVMECG